METNKLLSRLQIDRNANIMKFKLFRQLVAMHWGKIESCVRVFLVVLVTSGCASNNEDSKSAQNSIINHSVIQVYPAAPGDTNTLLRFGLLNGVTHTTEIVPAKRECEGAVGSVLPPLSVRDCFPALVQKPFDFLQAALSTALGGKNDHSTVFLPNADQFWIHQDDRNHCWAAALEIVRAIQGLHPLSQSDIADYGLAMCPLISSQQSKADAYQLIYIAKKLYQSFDRGRVNPDICTSSACIIHALQNSQPVIKLEEGHAVVIVGAEYDLYAQYPDTPNIIKLHILDPQTDPHELPKEKVISFLAACRADLFFVY